MANERDPSQDYLLQANDDELELGQPSSVLGHSQPSNIRVKIFGISVSIKRKDRYWTLLLLSAALAFLVFVSFLAGLLIKGGPPEKPQIRNVIFMISDGFGPASQTLARNYDQVKKSLDIGHKLPLDTILVGSSRTRSSSSLITDSAGNTSGIFISSRCNRFFMWC